MDPTPRTRSWLVASALAACTSPAPLDLEDSGRFAAAADHGRDAPPDGGARVAAAAPVFPSRDGDLWTPLRLVDADARFDLDGVSIGVPGPTEPGIGNTRAFAVSSSRSTAL